MEEIKELLEPSKNGKIIYLLLGISCCLLSLFWLFFDIKSGYFNVTSFIAVLFLILFGIYTIYTGLGKTEKYIIIRHNIILIKQHAILPVVRIDVNKVNKIEILPLSIVFYMDNRKKYTLRFGTLYVEVIDTIKDKVERFANELSIPIAFIREDIFNNSDNKEQKDTTFQA